MSNKNRATELKKVAVLTILLLENLDYLATQNLYNHKLKQTGNSFLRELELFAKKVYCKETTSQTSIDTSIIYANRVDRQLERGVNLPNEKEEFLLLLDKLINAPRGGISTDFVQQVINKAKLLL